MSYPLSHIAVNFAQHGVAIDTIARALAATPETIQTVLERARSRGELVCLPPEKPNTNMTLVTEITNLRAQLDDARYVIAEYRKPLDHTMNGILGLTKGEAQLVGVIAKYGRVTKERAYDEIFVGVADPPSIKLFDTQMCKIRPKLKAANITIKTIWGEGWEISNEDRAKLSHLVDHHPVCSE